MNRHTGFGIATTLLTLAGCISTRTSQGPAPSAPPPASSGPVIDASYDWHVLVLTPFGTMLKDCPIPLHEVLLFHDAQPAKAEVESKDCFALDHAPPRFVGQQPDQYLMCFDHDRLTRIESSVRLEAAEAPQVFARACTLWLKSTAPSTISGTTCEGRDGSTAFSGRLALVPGEPTASLSVTLVGDPRNDGHMP
jgi:hypothetical protein